MGKDSSIDKGKAGHRERLRNRFLSDEESSHTEEALLELLLTYAIPLKDVQPLARKLITEFGSLENVLEADIETLCKFDGIKDHSVTLLKLVDWIRIHRSSKTSYKGKNLQSHKAGQPPLIEMPGRQRGKITEIRESAAIPSIKMPIRRGTGLFGKAVLKEAIELLPKLYDIESLDDVREFLKKNLHFSAEQTRRRYADYIAFRMFSNGSVDKAIRAFALKYSNRQELKDVCFYRFCKTEQLMFDVIDSLFLPSIGIGRLKRARLKEYLVQRYPASRSIKDGARAIVDALAAGGMVRTDRTMINFAYRDILIPSFAFILHSEFPEPGMYDIAKLDANRAIRSMFWNPSRIMPSLYELRNQGIISKISEIDNIRQFTTKWTLEEVVTKLVAEGRV